MHRPAGTGVVAIGMAVAVLLALDLRYVMEVGPWPRTISHHGLGPDGWIFASAVAVLAAGSIGIAVSLVRRRMAPIPSVALLVVWSAGLGIVAWFPKTDWSVGPSLSGSIHRVGSIIAFVSLPIAALLISRHGRGRLAARIVAWLGIGSLSWVLLISGAMVYAAADGLRWWRVLPIDLVERGLAVTEIATLLALGVYAAARPRAEVPVRRPVTTST